MIFHVDANSFYASCERLFRPDLKYSPIAALSNNDGIIIALNKECKELGFKRGDVYFKVRKKCDEMGVVIFSSNYTLYSDISGRLNSIYREFAPQIEVYSIDESFLFFPELKNQVYEEMAKNVRETVKRDVGIPVSVGGAPTKTLAKFCNKLAKKRGGVCIREAPHDDELASALSDYAQEAVRRLRSENLVCRYVSVFLMTNPWSESGGQYHNEASIQLEEATSYLPDILRAALGLLGKIYRKGYRYRKIAVNLMGLEPETNIQADLFGFDAKRREKLKIMEHIDTLSRRYGGGMVYPLSRTLVEDSLDGEPAAWKMKREYLSPEYTTRLDELPEVR